MEPSGKKQADFPNQKLWTLPFVLLTAVQTMDLLTFHTITPVIAKFTLLQGAALAASGLAASVFSIAAIFARPISGLLADKLGRRSIILTSIAVSTLMQLGYAFVSGFAPLLALRVVHGFFYALFGTAISAMALAVIPESRRNEGMGWFGAAYVVASIIGPAMGVALSDAFGFNCMFLVTAGVAAASFPLAVVATSGEKGETRRERQSQNGDTDRNVTKTEAKQPQKPRPPALRELVSVRCIPLAAIACCFMASWGMIASYIVLVGEARDVAGVSAFFVANSLTLFVTRPAIGKISDKYGLARLILPAIAIEACALSGICFAHDLWLFLAAASFKAFGSGGVLPSIQAECGKLETPARSGVAMSTYLLGSDIGYAVGPLIGGIMASAVGYEYLLFATLPITAVALVIYLVWNARLKKESLLID